MKNTVILNHYRLITYWVAEVLINEPRPTHMFSKLCELVGGKQNIECTQIENELIGTIDHIFDTF